MATAEQTADIVSEGAVDIAAACEFTGLGRTHLYALMERGELPYSKQGRRRLIPRRSLVDLLRKGLVAAK